MKHEQILIFSLFLLLPFVKTNHDVTFVKGWRDILLTDGEHGVCSLSVDGCERSTPYNATKKIEKAGPSVNSSEKETALPEKSIENFDEWTKKRRDAVANQNGLQQKTIEPTAGSTIRKEEVVIPLPPIPRPARNFASKECGAKIIAANPEAENAKAVVNEKDVDDYMRNPCQSAKEKFIVIELCEAIQIKKIALGNFELFASRPKTIQVFISERYPPLANWISLGSFHLQDHHKNLQTFEVPTTNVYAKYVRINLEDHYGKEHYCIVSVVNVMGITLADQYDDEEAAAHMLNVIEEKAEEPITTPPPSEQKMQTQLPIPPRAPNQTFTSRERKFDFRRVKSTCKQCSVDKVSYLICHLLPNSSVSQKNNLPPRTSTIKPAVSEKRDFALELGIWADRHRLSNFEQSRRRNIASIQRFLPKNQAGTVTTTPPTPTSIPTPKTTQEKSGKPSEKSSTSEDPPKVQPASAPDVPKVPKAEPILPAGGSTSQRDMVIMKMNKRVSAVELNLTLTTEYLSELSKQYVSQMGVYQQELKDSRKDCKSSAQAVEGMRSEMNRLKRKVRDLRQTIYIQELKTNRYTSAQNEMSRNVLLSSCHISNVPPHPTLPRLPLVIPSINHTFENFTKFEERMKKIYETAKSVMLGSISWNTDHLIVALISFNVAALSFLFAGVFYIHRRNKERCEETQVAMKTELRARIAKVGVENRKLISKGMRRAELAVTAAVSSALKIEKSSTNRKAMSELESALANLFAAQQERIEERFEQNQRLLRDVIAEGRRSREDDTFSVEDSESSSETEQNKEDTPTFEQE